jgi:hypothetical protein
MRPPRFDNPTPLIIDTDMSIDADDVGALCVAHALVDRGEARLLAVTHDTGYSQGVGGVSVINTYYGRGDVPLGVYTGDVGNPASTPLYAAQWTNQAKGWYVEGLVSSFPSRVRTAAQAPPAVDVLRRALASSSELVTFVALGHATNLHALLSSAADAASPLTGVELVASRVSKLVWMGGSLRDSWRAEWNFGACGRAEFCGPGWDGLGELTAATLDLWPRTVPIVFVSFEAGAELQAGGVLLDGAPSSSPCRAAYMSFCGCVGGEGRLPDWCGQRGRSAWDLMAVELAVRGPSTYYALEPGVNTITRYNGANEWRTTDAAHAYQWQAVLLIPPVHTPWDPTRGPCPPLLTTPWPRGRCSSYRQCTTHIRSVTTLMRCSCAHRMRSARRPACHRPYRPPRRGHHAHRHPYRRPTRPHRRRPRRRRHRHRRPHRRPRRCPRCRRRLRPSPSFRWRQGLAPLLSPPCSSLPHSSPAVAPTSAPPMAPMAHTQKHHHARPQRSQTYQTYQTYQLQPACYKSRWPSSRASPQLSSASPPPSPHSYAATLIVPCHQRRAAHSPSHTLRAPAATTTRANSASGSEWHALPQLLLTTPCAQS